VKDKENLGDRDLFQVSATVITGALIFVTVSTIAAPSQSYQTNYFKLLALLTGFGTITAFSLSCFAIMMEKITIAEKLMRAGFLYLGAVAVLDIISVFLQVYEHGF
jgi:hypothetical protein